MQVSLTPLRLALVTAVFLLVSANLAFWQRTAAALWAPTPAIVAFFAALTLVLLFATLLPLLLAPSGWPLRLVATVLVIVASAAGHFMDGMGTPMTSSMMRNLLETDAAEVHDLLNMGLMLRVGLLGLLPAIFIWRVRLVSPGGWRDARNRAVLASGLLLAAVLALVSSAPLMAVFLREHKVLRAYANPVAPLFNFFAALPDVKPEQGELVNPADTTSRGPELSRPRVFVLVLGETARAANFQLGGYARPTNPRLSTTPDVTWFSAVSSCGTSTAESVPCMFSHLGQEGSRRDSPARYENLLDTLTRKGVEVLWFDNNSGCKGVCDRIPTSSFSDDALRRLHADECRGMHCRDAVLTHALDAALASITRDTLIVLHQVGSHGPAYADRYPPAFRRFMPACELGDLSRCDRQSLLNAYDNTILYTDHNLVESIAALRRHAGRFQPMLLYVSDHGESLGEAGIYLHGLPRSFAPETQTHVPMVTWMPRETRDALGISATCLSRLAREPLSHDNLYHTVAGYFAYTGRPYQARLDLIADCQDSIT